MKDIGFTDTGDRIVEMSREEHDAFSMLCMSVEGRSFPHVIEARRYQFESGFDFTKTFDVIRAYYLGNFYTNQFQGFLDNIKKSLKES